MAVPFTFALNTSTIRPAPLPTKIEVAAKAGFDAIELWNDDVTAYVEGGGSLDDVKAALEDHDLWVPTMVHIGGWMDREGDAYTEALDEARRKMDQAAYLGAPRIIAGPPRGPYDLDRAARKYAELLKIGRDEFGVLPAMEFLGFVEGINSIKSAWEIVTRAGDPTGSVVLDPFHIFRGGSSIEDIDLIPPDRIAVYHFNDAPGTKPRPQQSDADRVLPGDGILPLAYQLRHLARIGYTGAVSLELFNKELWKREPLEVAKEGIAKMKELAETV